MIHEKLKSRALNLQAKVYSLEDAEYGRAVTYTKGDKIESGVLKDLIVDLDLIFTD